MAIFKSHIVASASGSVGGVTYSRNRFGMYIRSRSMPVNPNTSRQQAVRSVMTEVVEYWNSILTAAQRAAWDTYAANVPVINKLGDTVRLTGFNMWVRSMTALQQGGLDIVADGPVVFSLPETDDSLAVATDVPNQEIDVSFDNTKAWANEDGGALLIKMGLPKLVTRNFFNGPWRYAGVVEGDGVTPPTSPAAIAVPFPVAVGQKLWIEARIARADGRLSAPFRASVTAS